MKIPYTNMPSVQRDGQIYNALATKLRSWACLIQIQCSKITSMPVYLSKNKINVSFHHMSNKLLKQDHRHAQRTPNKYPHSIFCVWIHFKF